MDALKLSGESSNLTTTIDVPNSRWVLWTNGPLRGPAVRLWVVMAVAVLGAFLLGRLPLTPLRGSEWALLALGLTQVDTLAALLVVGWLFLLAWRGTSAGTSLRPWAFNALQVVLGLGAFLVVLTLLSVLNRGLLGSPEMMVLGNGSSEQHLCWFTPQADGDWPRPEVITVSVWFYRLLMLLWALWLATATLRWSRWSWDQFSREQIFKSFRTK